MTINSGILDKKISTDLENIMNFMDGKTAQITYLSSLRNIATTKQILSLKDIKNAWYNKLQSDSNPNLNFYIHIPFCAQKCYYCKYYTENHTPEYTDKYINYLIYYFKEFKDTFEKQKFDSLYIGGGTPSILTTKQLNKLLYYLFENYRFKELAHKSLEVNPNSFSLDKIDLIKKYGFTKVTMGMQSSNSNVLAKNNRQFHSISKIKKLIDYLHSNGFSTSIDAMMGLPGDSTETLIETMDVILGKIKPHSVILADLLPRDEKYLIDNYGTVENFNQKSFNIKQSSHDKIKELAIKHEYNAKMDFSNQTGWSFHLQGQHSKYINYKSHGYENTNCFGLGTESESYIQHKMEYKIQNPGNIKHTLRGIKQTKFLAQLHPDNFECILFVIDKLTRDSSISQQEFLSTFKRSIESVFEYPINALTRLNKIYLQEGQYYFTPKKHDDRFKYALFFLGHKFIKEKLLDSK